jgi:hypothetical protein
MSSGLKANFNSYYLPASVTLFYTSTYLVDLARLTYSVNMLIDWSKTIIFETQLFLAKQLTRERQKI